MNLSLLFSDWIKKVENENPPGPEIVAINFGIFQSDKGFMIFITGSEIYDASDDDWAGEIDYQPSRANKYFLLPREITAGLKWAKVLELATNSMKQLIETEPQKTLFGNRVVTIGFDDNKLTVIKNA